MGTTQSHLGVVNRVSPETQHKWAEKNATAYTWLYVALGFAAGVLLCLAVAWILLQRKNKRESKPEKVNNSFLPTSASAPRNSSLFDGSVTTSTVQPRSDSTFRKLSFPAQGKGMNFGTYSNIPQQPPAVQSEALLQALNETKGRSRTSSNNDTGSGKGSLTKTDSLDYYYDMDQNERTPLQQRLADSAGFNSYLRLTTVDMERLNSIPDSETSTFPISNIRKDSSVDNP